MAIDLMTPPTDPRQRRFTVRVNPIKLEGGPFTETESSDTKIVVETRLRFQKKQSLLSPRKELRKTSSLIVVGKNGGVVEWGENDDVLTKNCSGQCKLDLSFVVLRERKGEESEKWEEMGRVGMRNEELGKRKEMEMKMEMEEMLPIRLKSGSGAVSLAMLTVAVRIAADEGGVGELGEPSKAGVFKRLMSLGFKSMKKKMMRDGHVGGSPESGELTRSTPLPSSGSQRGVIEFLKRKVLLFCGSSRKVEPVMKKMYSNENENEKWEEKKIGSRDSEAEVKCSVVLATFDQRSKDFAGEGASSAIAAEVAHWLHENKDRVPNGRELDMLMVAGAAEWKKLGENVANFSRFPDKHFVMETVLRTGTRRLGIVQGSSVVGFFSPEKFELLNGVMSVDGIWDVIVRKSGVYIVSWNDHFCVLKVEQDACYIIDSLGERLEEGCKQAFILKFDESSVISYRRSQTGPDAATKKKRDETTSSAVEANKTRDARKTSIAADAKMTQGATTSTAVGAEIEAEAGVIEPVAGVEIKDDEEEEGNLMICRGRECCKEFFKRFLAAMLVRNLEKIEAQGILGSADLHRRLQIEFQYTTCILK